MGLTYKITFFFCARFSFFIRDLWILSAVYRGKQKEKKKSMIGPQVESAN